MYPASLYKVTRYRGEDAHPEVNFDNEGWSKDEDLKFDEFRGRRSHAPDPLPLNDTVFEDEIFPLRTTINADHPVFDWGLGCFGNSTKLVDTGKEELVDLYWTDFHEIRTAKELMNGNQVWNDDDWIRYKRVYQREEEDKSVSELIQFHEREKADEEAQYKKHQVEASEFFR
ncbi:uncharacterized protein F4822DRAFT_430445 [Hypoxylon trugodes]|uniref:uncharacterized protein n=1 Tax=Hypoxylon trugodes TaxID=326681 RepID=UPI002195CCFB|nr:uncharacterized protein F4822DRAFT_430445 [Hypoxylon trugodes]KAI1387698.1 hypothetical protein F4822DRAFT_430445 [Hypoxylon trugodes]